MFKIEWDKEYNGVKLVTDSSKETINIPPRPVFFDELDLFRLDALGWKYPKCVEPLLWACDRRYFYRGIEVMVVKGGNLYDNPIIDIKEAGKGLILKPINLDKLRKRNEKLLSLLEFEAMNFIIDTFRNYSNKKINDFKFEDEIDFSLLSEKLGKATKQKHVIIKEDCDSFDIMSLKDATEQGKRIVHTTKIDKFLTSFSGGKDSQVLLDLVARALPPSEFIVIYSDTGYELPPSLDIYKETIEKYKAQSEDFQFYTARNHQSVLHYWDQIGSPSNIHRWCCSVMKTAPLYRLLKDINGTGKQPKVLTFDGVRAEESETRSGYARIGKAVKHNNVINASPILFWNTTEIFLYILGHNLPINIAYRSGFSRVGCITCPFSSEWNDHLANKVFQKELNPFIEKITNITTKSGIQDVNVYIKTGKWKLRAGGREIESISRMEILTSTPDFKAILYNPKTDFMEWLKILGTYKISSNENTTHCELFHKGNIHRFQFHKDGNNNLIIFFPNIGNETILIGHFKRILYKATHCIHCESCEVECPTGALKVEKEISINELKCIHCLKCITFCDKGCIVANSLATTNTVNMKNNKGTINPYNNFGCRDKWISKFLGTLNNFFESDHGLNIKEQLPPFTKWLIEAELLQSKQKTCTKTAEILSSIYLSNPELVWEIIWINLSRNSRICNWYSTTIKWNSLNSREEIIVKLNDSFPEYMGTTLTNVLTALFNTFKESPLGDEFGQAVLEKKLVYSKLPKYEASKEGIAYMLYKYAETHNNYSLRVSEMMRFDCEGSVYNLFGIEKSYFETVLRTLHNEKEPVLHADLNMGLDNISLRPELTSTNVLEIMLKYQ